MHLDLLSIPQSGGNNVKTFRWYHSLKKNLNASRPSEPVVSHIQRIGCQPGKLRYTVASPAGGLPLREKSAAHTEKREQKRKSGSIPAPLPYRSDLAPTHPGKGSRQSCPPQEGRRRGRELRG